MREVLARFGPDSRGGGARPRRARGYLAEALEGRALLARLVPESPAYVMLGDVGGKFDRADGVFALSDTLKSDRHFFTFESDHDADNPFAPSGDVTIMANATNSGADADTSVDAFGVSFSAIASGKDLSYYSAGSFTSKAEAGTGPGNPGGWLSLRITAEQGEKDGDPVDVTIASVLSPISFYSGTRGSIAHIRLDYHGTQGPATLLELERTGNTGNFQPEDVTTTFRSAIGQTVLISASITAQVDDTDLSPGVGSSSATTTVSGGMAVSLKVVPKGTDPTPITKPRPPAYKLKNSSVKVPSQVAAKLAPIAQAFQKQRKKQLTVTDGARTPRDQANEILKKYFKDGEKATSKLYSNGANIKEIIKAIKAEPDGTRLLEKVTGVIQGQVDRGKYISSHLQQNGVDIRSDGLNAQDIAALKKLVVSSGGKFLDERKSKAGPHFHVSFGPPVASTPLP